jgi:hypothetical protein
MSGWTCGPGGGRKLWQTSSFFAGLVVFAVGGGFVVLFFGSPSRLRCAGFVVVAIGVVRIVAILGVG